MQDILYPWLRAALFLLPPERAHALVLNWLETQVRLRPCHSQPTGEAVRVMGIHFPSRVGLAAGFDKNGDHIPALSSLGFGFLEIGTVTPRAQEGRALPRIFRLIHDQALINRMGFPNKGVDYLVERLKALPTLSRPVLGINIGKNADTSLEEAHQDYSHCFTRVYPHADYIAVNLSSPNTPGLRELQGGTYLPGLLAGLKSEQKRLADQTGRYVPLVVKVSPDLNDSEIAEISQIILDSGIEGLIATNTTLSRHGLRSVRNTTESGGLSGAPVMARSTAVLAAFNEHFKGKVALIGVGGIMTSADAQAKFAAGAQLVQVYTGLIYKGPGLVKSLIHTPFNSFL